MNNTRILGIIPARGGSKGVPRKNIRPLAGKPLIAWTIEQAQKSALLTRTIVSTDDDEIATVAKKYEADVPFMRPSEYAQDKSPSSEAIIHAIDYLAAQGEHYEYIALLEPTSPLRKNEDIDEALKLLIASPQSDAVISMGEVHTEHPLIVKKIVNNQVEPYIEDAQKIWQRQQADEAYFPYGVIYAVTVESYKKYKTFYLKNACAYIIDRWQNYEIDDMCDFIITEAIIKHYKLGS